MDNIILEVFGFKIYKILAIYFTILFIIVFTLFTILLIKILIEGVFK